MRITTRNRTRLETVIPLDTPYIIFIDPANVCNLKCSYCPTGHPDVLKRTNRKPAIMGMDLFEDIIDQCCDFPRKIKVLRLYKDGEPLLNKRLADMIWYASEKDKFRSIDTTTNGLLLNQWINTELVAAGLTRINLSVPKDYDQRYLDTIDHLYHIGRHNLEIFAKIAGDYLTEDERQKFLKDFKPITDDCAIEHTAPCWPGFDVEQPNLDVGVYGQPLPAEVKTCPYIFYSLAVNADGSVSQCFLDWNYSNLMGDLNAGDHIVNIWNSDRFNLLREYHLRGERSNIVFCCDCQQLKYGMPDNIDPYASELLRRIRK